MAAHNIASVHQKDWDWLGMQTIKLRQGDHEIIATVYDLCSDSDCDGCCTQNLGPVNSDGNSYLIDIEAYTKERFGSGEGIVEFQICSDEADNIIWLWCPNVTDEPREAWNAAMNYYPGDDYVDWTCVDGYNWGDAGGAGWQSFEEIFADIYPQLADKNKPILIGEMASAEIGGNKAEFIDGIIPTLKSKFPLIKGLVWFDVNKETDWRISSSPESEAAFIEMAADPYFSPN